MKLNRIFLVGLILLTILTIGAVSASDNTDFNETLTVDIAEEVSADASLDENDVSDGGDVIAASESDDVICDGNSTSGSGDVNPIFDGNSTKLNPGMNVNVEDTEYGEPVEVEITFDNLDSGEVSASVDGFNYAVNIVNGSGSLNICNLNIGSYILEVAYAGDDTYYATMVTAQFSVLPGENSTGEDGTGIIINGDDRFVYEYEAHESSSKGDDEVLRVRWDDVDGGTLTLTVRGDYITKTFDADIDGKNEYSWTLNDLGLENYGVYRFTLTYNDNITIFSGLPFQLMWCNIEEYKDEDVYVDYPFDVIRIYEQPNTLELYVDDNENPSQPGNRQSSTFWYPTVWNLGELGITSPGEYNILIKAYEDENLIETFSMTLNVIGFDENEYRIFTNYEGVHDFDGDAPVVYLYCPEDAEGNISVYVNDNFVGNFANDAGNMISWTLSDLGIDQNGDYSIVVKEGSDDEIAQTDLNIWHLGNGNNNDINLWVNTEDEFSTNPEDLPTIFAAVNVPEGTEGNVTFTIDGNVLYNLALSGFYDGSIDHENNIYNIALEVDGDFIFEGLNSEDVVKFAFLDENGDEVTSKEYMIFFGDNTVRFEENDNGNGEDNQIGVDIWDENDERGTLYTDSEGDVVGIYVPRDYEGTVFRIYVNGNETVSWEAEFDGDNQGEYKAWGLEELGISEAGDYNIVVESDNGEGREILSNTTITVSEFNEDTYRAMILYAREVIKFYTPQNCEGTITINTKKERGDDDYEEVFDETYEITDEYRGNWKEFALADIGFEADGAFRIFTITVNNATGDEVYSYRISHVGAEEEPNGDWYEEKVEFGFNGPDDEPIEFNKTSDVLVAWLYIPDGIEHEDFADVSATVYIILNGEIIKTVRTSDFTEPLDWPNHYPIIMDLSHLQDRDQLSFRVDAIHENTSESAISEDEEERMVIIEDKGDYVIFHDDVDLERLEFDVFRGNLTLGTTNDPDLMGVIKYNLVIITISDSLGITEGTITVSDGESTVFTRQLSEFEKEYDYGSDGYTYYLSLDEVKDILPEGVNLTVSFNYADNTLAQKRIRFEDYLYSIVTVEDINNQFQFEVQDDLMLHENDTAIYLNTNTNRQAIYFDLGGGYFTVYVNGVKVENLGRVSFNTWMNKEYWRDDDDDYIERFNYDEEAFLNYVASYWGSELELFRLTSWNQGAPEIEITLADLGINESGTYNIRITHYPSVPGGLDDHSSLGVESIYAGEMLIPTVTEVLNTNITCNFDPDYAGVNIYPVTLYGNGIPFLFTFNFGDNIISESNSVLIYVDGELAFNSTILYYDENDEGEMELCNLWIVGPEMLSEDLFDECGYLAVGEYEAVVYLVKGDDAPVEIGRGNFSRIKQRGNMSFTIGSSVEGDGVHTIIYADIPEGDWTDYTLEIVIADSERVYSKGGGLYDYWFNEYVIFKDNQIYFKDSLENVIGKGPVAIDLGVLDEGTHIFVALEHGEETVFGDWDFYHYCFAVSNSNASAPLVDCNLTVEAADISVGESVVIYIEINGAINDEVLVSLSGVNYTVTVTDGKASLNIPGLTVGNYEVAVMFMGNDNYCAVFNTTSFTVISTLDGNVTKDNFFLYFDENGELTSDLDELKFIGDFTGLEVDSITINSPVVITGEDATFTDVSFYIASDDVGLTNIVLTYTAAEDKDAYAVLANNVSDLIMENNIITYVGTTNGTFINNALRVNGGSNIQIRNNRFVITIPSSPVKWVEEPVGSGNYVSYIISEGIVFKDCSEVEFDSNMVKVNFNDANGDYDTIYSIDVKKSNNVKISNNVIQSSGNTYMYGIIVSGDDFEISGNNINVTSNYYVNGIDIEGPAIGVVENNIIDVRAPDMAYAVYSGLNGQNVSAYTGNTITGEAYFAVGFSIWDVESVLVNNTVMLNANYTKGIAFREGDVTIIGNTIILNSSEKGNETIYELFGTETEAIKIVDANANIINNVIETCGTGVTVNGNANIISNKIDSNGKAISLNENSSNVFNNTLTGYVAINSDGNNVSDNIIDSDNDYAIEINASNNYIGINDLTARETEGIDAIKNDGENNIIIGANTTVKCDSPIFVEASDSYLGENQTICVCLPGNATGQVRITLDSDSYSVEVMAGKAILVLSDLDAGNYTIFVEYLGDANYVENATSVEFMVKVDSTQKLDFNVTVVVSDIVYGDDAHIEAFLPGDVTGYINVIVDGKIFNVTHDDGKVVCDVSGLMPGDYLVVVSVAGDSRYYDKNASASFSVSKKDSFVNAEYADGLIYITVPDNATGFVEIFVGQYDNFTVVVPIYNETGYGGNSTTVNINATSIDHMNATSLGKFYNVTVVDGKAILNVSDLDAGEYTAEISYLGDDYYLPSSCNVSFSVVFEPVSPGSLIVDAADVLVGDNAVVNIEFAVDGSVTVTVDGKSYTVDVVDGKASVAVGVLSAGEYDVLATFNGNAYYLPVMNTTKFTVNKKEIKMELTVDSIVYGEETIILELTEDLDGEVFININGTNYTASIKNRQATFNVSGLDAGNYELIAEYKGNDNYYSKTTTFKLNVEKVNVTFNLTVDSIVYNENETIEIDVGEDITGEIFIDIGNKTFTTYVDNRKAIFDVTGLDAGNHKVVLRYAGNNNYYNNEVIYNITVKQAEVNMTTHVGTLKYSKNNTVEINVPEGVTGNIVIIIGNRTYTTVIDNRVAIFHIENFNAGNYEVTAIYEGNNNYYNKTTLFNITIEKMDVTFETDVNEVSYSEQNALRINVPEGVEGNVTVIIGDYVYNTIVLDGVIEYYITNINAGNYAVRVIYGGNDNYYHNETTFNITIKKLDVDIELKQDTITYNKTNSFVLNIPEGVDGNITVRIGNDTYNTVIDNRTATVNVLNIKAGNYLLEARYVGNNNYNNVTKFFNITIEKMHVGIELSVGSVSYNKNQTLDLIFPEEATGNVSIFIGNRTVKTTVINGHATFNVMGIDAGNYEAKVVYEGNDYYNEETTFVNITVEKIDVGIILKTPTIVYNREKSLTLNLSDIATGNVSVQIGNDTFTSVVDEKGEVTFDITGINAGVYTIKTIYSGDNNYNSFETIFNLTVSKLNALFDAEANDTNYGEAECIVVGLPQDATGMVNVVIGDDSYIAEIVDGVAIVNVTGLIPGVYDAVVNYLGDVNYNVNTVNVTFKVNKVEVPISIVATNVTAGQVTVITVYLPDDATGGINIDLPGSIQYMSDYLGGNYVKELTYGQAGTFTASVAYDGNDRYLPGNASTTFSVTALPVTMEITAEEVYAGDVAAVVITLPSDAVGSISISYPGGYVGSNINNGKYSFEHTFATPGNYTINVDFRSTGIYESVSNSTVLIVKERPVDSNMSISLSDVKKGDDEVIEVTLPRDATGSVTLIVNNETFTGTIENGKATFTLSNLDIGEYNISVIYSGDGKYLESVKTATFNINALGTVIVVESKFSRYATDFDAGERGGMFYGTLYDVNANPLANKTVQVTVNGALYNITTDDEGKIGLRVNLAKANTYTYAMLFYGDEEFKASPMASSKLTVVKKLTSIIANNMAFKTSAKTKTVTVALNTIKNPYDGKMYLKTGKKLTLTVDGKTYTAKTGENGVANFNIKITKKGTYTAKITFDGDSTYDSTSKSIRITVSKAPSKNTALKGVGVGTTPANVDAGGELNIEGNYSEYLENENVTSSEVSSDKLDTVIDVASTFTRVANDFNAGERGDYFYATLKDINGNALANKTVQIAINGPVYPVVTDSQGRAGLKVNLASANTYTYALTFSGDDEYNPAPIASSKLTLTKKTTSISASDVSIKKSAKTKIVSVTLKTIKNPYDGKTYLSSGKKLTLKVDGKTYTAKINEKGVAKFTIKLTKKGKYSAKVIFDGDSTYSASSKGIKITIK